MRRPPAVAANGMVATSQPLATRAGLRALESGGNAADAALAAAAVLAVTEPTGNGIGGDNFAIVWKRRARRRSRLSRCGPADVPSHEVTTHGAESVTVPGAVGGWAALAERYGKLGLDRCLSDAIDAAENGFAVTPLTAAAWARGAHVPEEYLPAPRVGEIVRLPDLAGTLRGIAENGPSAFYEGDVARSIASVTWLDEEDLAAHEARWVEPLSIPYRGHTVLELPPPTQGVAALEGLGLLERSSPSLASQIRCMQLALEDAFARVRDGADVSDLLEPAFLDGRRAESPARVAEPAGGTVYLCAVDSDRMAVSFIQSNYMGFGSGSRAPGTGSPPEPRRGLLGVRRRRARPPPVPHDHPRDAAARREARRAVRRHGRLSPGSGPSPARLGDRGRRSRPSGRARAAAVHGGRRRREAGGGALGARCRPRQARHRDCARDERRLLRRRPGDPRRGRRPRRRLRPAQRRLRRRLRCRAPSPGSRSRR